MGEISVLYELMMERDEPRNHFCYETPLSNAFDIVYQTVYLITLKVLKIKEQDNGTGSIS